MKLSFRRARAIGVVGIASLVWGALAAAQPSAPPSTTETQAANALYQAASDWPAVERAYRALAEAQPNVPQFRFRLGVALLEQGRGADAVASFEKAEALGTPAAQAAFRQAAALVLSGDRDRALAEIERAGRAGFASTALLENDPRLATLKNDSRWAAAYAAVDKNSRPCFYDPHYREFDFWVGTWDVRPNGAPESSPPATNVVTSELDGCVIHEHWTGAGSAGESFNLWDATRDAWIQTWVDNSGGLHEYRGHREGDALIYFGESPPPAGLGFDPKLRVKTRLTFFSEAPDRVRQLSERTLDDGQSWTVNYDLIYKRRKSAP